jgi:hypothetical protein
MISAVLPCQECAEVPFYWAVPVHERSKVNAAGRILVQENPDPFVLADATEVINNWRSSHNFPLNTFQSTLRDKARDIYEHALVAQRLKRLDSIKKKLQREPQMKLTQMQDIGGCRAVLETVGHVEALRNAYFRSRMRHVFHHPKDYIAEPKDSGYRSLHLIYTYNGEGKSQVYNGLKIELQFRSLHQHAWATAVEVAGTFQRESLKSSEGPEEWLRFFKLVSCAFARHEKSPLVPDTPTTIEELNEEIRRLRGELDVNRKFMAYRGALELPDNPDLGNADYVLLVLDLEAMKLRCWGYTKEQLPEANEHYINVERSVEGRGQAVLVGLDRMQSLRRAYPNWYADTQRFMDYVSALVGVV